MPPRWRSNWSRPAPTTSRTWRPSPSRTPTWLPVARCGSRTGCAPWRRWPAATGLAVHLDGARLWHAAIASGQTMRERAALATTVTCCLSKGLGAPVGSVLAGPADLMDAAVLERKRLGGAMRQSGVIAAAGLVAMRHGFDRLADDHERAQRLAGAVADRWPEAGLDPKAVVTNIVVFSHPNPARLIDYLEGEGVLAGTVAPGVVRLVTHADVDDQGIEVACQAIAALRSHDASDSGSSRSGPPLIG